VKVAIVTGDHYRKDPEKPGSCYSKDDLEVHNQMDEAFTSFKDLEVHVINSHENLQGRILDINPQIIVNFCDTGFENRIELESSLPSLFDMLRIPYTGSSALGLVTCYDKSSVRLIAESIKIEVPKEQFVEFGKPPEWTSIVYPVLIKPNRSDGSFGITKDSVVFNQNEANL
jgi:D-alanine-D-alanine ligase